MTLEEWTKIKNLYTNEIRSLSIPEMPTEQDIKSLISRIDNLFSRAALTYADVKIADDNINRLLDSTVVANRVGGNDSERRAQGIISAMNYNLDGQTVNLFDLQKESNQRYVFMQQVMKVLDQKLKSLTISYGVIKVESSFSR